MRAVCVARIFLVVVPTVYSKKARSIIVINDLQTVYIRKIAGDVHGVIQIEIGDRGDVVLTRGISLLIAPCQRLNGYTKILFEKYRIGNVPALHGKTLFHDFSS